MLFGTLRSKIILMRIIIAAALVTLSVFSAAAQDRFFARTYNSTVLPKGVIDLEFWHTSRVGHKGQFFHAQDQRLELEFGLGRNWQTAFYFNSFQKRFSVGDEGTTTTHAIGFSNEWKVKLLDPSFNKIGLALYGEWGIKGGDELELESKIILDKIIGKHVVAFNGTLEYEKEFEWENGEVESDGYKMPVEFDLGYLYNIKPSFGLGFEIRNHNEIAKGEGWENSVLYAGPTINYRGNRWFVVANYLPQLANIHKTEEFSGKKELAEHERAEARILIGISF